MEGELDETGVDAKSTAKLNFSDGISAEIQTAIQEQYKNNLIVEADNLRLEIPDPWHCGQFNNGKALIKFSDKGKDEFFEITDEVVPVNVTNPVLMSMFVILELDGIPVPIIKSFTTTLSRLFKVTVDTPITVDTPVTTLILFVSPS